METAERIFMFLPSITIIAFVCFVFFLYRKSLQKYFKANEINLTDIKWVQENKYHLSWKIFPLNFIYAPMVQGLIFSAPIIIAYPKVTNSAYYFIAISSILFATTWLFHTKLFSFDIKVKEKSNLETWDKVVGYILSLFIGFISIYCGVNYQSLWTSIGIEITLEILLPIVVFPIAMFISLLFRK